MHYVRYDLQSNKPLPPCEGPKLEPFKDRHSRIQFIRLLSPAPIESSSSGGHSHVFEVRIRRTNYALKIVSVNLTTV